MEPYPTRGLMMNGKGSPAARISSALRMSYSVLGQGTPARSQACMVRCLSAACQKASGSFTAGQASGRTPSMCSQSSVAEKSVMGMTTS